MQDTELTFWYISLAVFFFAGALELPAWAFSISSSSTSIGSGAAFVFPFFFTGDASLSSSSDIESFGARFTPRGAFLAGAFFPAGAYISSANVE